MARFVIFIILAVMILVNGLLAVTTKRIMRAATYLLFVLFGVAGIYFVLNYSLLGAVQLSVYAGGVVVLYVFAISLTNKNELQGMVERIKGGRVWAGALAALAGLATLLFVFFKNAALEVASSLEEISMTEIGHALLGSDKYGYVLPFEFISVFLLACIIGAVLIARKD